MSNVEQSFLLPSREKLEDRGAFFYEFKKYLDDMQADAWHSRRELQAFRLLLDQLGGSVKLDLKGNTKPPSYLHMGLDGVVAVTDDAMEWPKELVSVRLLAQAPQQLQMLSLLRDAWLDGDMESIEGILTGDVLTDLLDNVAEKGQ